MRPHLKWNGCFYRHNEHLRTLFRCIVDEPVSKCFLPFDRMKHYLMRQGLRTREQAERYFAAILRTDQAEASIQNPSGKQYQHRLSLMPNNRTDHIEEVRLRIINEKQVSRLCMKLLFISFCRHIVRNVFSRIVSTRTWLFIFTFLICAFEASFLTPNNPTFTVFRVVFEIVSAFGGCGLSMGCPSSSLNLAAAFSASSKIVLICVMCMGRHRGLLDSMKDQEEIEYSAHTLINGWRQLAIYEEQQKSRMKTQNDNTTTSFNIDSSASQISTRF